MPLGCVESLSMSLKDCGFRRRVGTFGPLSQRVHVGKWYILRAQRGSHIPTLRAKYIPYSYMDPLGV